MSDKYYYFLVFDEPHELEETDMFDAMGFTSRKALRDYIKDMGIDEPTDYQVFSVPQNAGFFARVSTQTVVEGLGDD